MASTAKPSGVDFVSNRRGAEDYRDIIPHHDSALGELLTDRRIAKDGGDDGFLAEPGTVAPIEYE